MNGNIYLSEEDILVQGIEPLSFKRNYVSLKGFGNWMIHNCPSEKPSNWLLDEQMKNILIGYK